MIISEGSAEVSVADIAAEAGLAKGTFYLYFNNKEQLMATLRELVTAEFADLFRLPSDLRSPDAWRRVLHAELIHLIDVQLKYQTLYRAVCPPGDHTGAMSAKHVLGVLRHFISEGHAVGVFRVEDADLAAAFIFNAIQGAVVHAPEPIERERLVGAAVQFAERSLGIE